MNGDEIYNAIVRGVRIGLGEIVNQQMHTWALHPGPSDPKDTIIGQVWAEVSNLSIGAPDWWDWQPVSSIPKEDGRKVFVRFDHKSDPEVWTCQANPKFFAGALENGVTHWMPIPPLPKSDKP